MTVMEEQLTSRSVEMVVTETAIAGGLALASFIGNALVLLSVLLNARLRKQQYLYIANYAFIDLLVACAVLLLSIYALALGSWPVGATICTLQGHVVMVLPAITNITMAISAVDRAFATSKPISHATFFTRRYTSILIMLCWLVVLALPASFFINNRKFVFHPGYALCKTDEGYMDTGTVEFFYAVVPFIITGISYVNIKIGLRKNAHALVKMRHHAQWEFLSSWRAEDAVTALYAALAIAVLLCALPGYAFNAALGSRIFFDPVTLPRSLYLAGTYAFALGSAVKPMIIVSKDKDFAAALRRILRCSKRSSAKVGDIPRIYGGAESVLQSDCGAGVRQFLSAYGGTERAEPCGRSTRASSGRKNGWAEHEEGNEEENEGGNKEVNEEENEGE
ncbi:predicted protein [Nematostella vectensis]|uniref:G-protein coupled receptors family 1 profile domain-containing protein n=1 Tax=Nematostella vectensis TaxID=45351 RepID=A7S737_NEMVE|nr:predicted protein [Nematostella vectensis]|eukprot:XP_001632526.1 predicted protein [Nematostella vectensis]